MSLDGSGSPQQLLVPILIDTWYGKAIVHTGASYTLVHECLWMELKHSAATLKPWTEGPLYLANGEAATPIGWEKLNIELQGRTARLRAAVLDPTALAYGVVLGLDFISSIGMIINVADKVNSFELNPNCYQPLESQSSASLFLPLT